MAVKDEILIGKKPSLHLELYSCNILQPNFEDYSYEFYDMRGEREDLGRGTMERSGN